MFRLIELGGEPVLASVPVISDHEIEELRQAPPQKQAERLLERSINGYRGANELIAAEVGTGSALRERAACSIAQSGMFEEEIRRTAIPDLLDFAEDPVLDAQTRKWVFQALRDITGQVLPNDPSTWRDW